MKTLSNQQSPNRAGKLLLPSLLTGALLFLAGCAGTPPPTAQVAVSNAAVASAVNSGGGELAPVEMQMARDKMDRAKLAMAAKDYKLAGSLSQEAQVDAQLAEAKSRSSKAREAATELQEGIRVLREELERKNK